MSAQMMRSARRAAWVTAAAWLICMGPASTDAASVTYEHDARGRLVKATYDDGTVVDYTYDANGNRQAAAVTLPVDATPPSVPANLTAAPASPSQINLSWSASTDNVGVTGYRLERCTGVGCTSFVQIATPSTTSYVDSGRTSSTTYLYRVRAYDAAGNVSAFSASASATTPDATAPSAPGVPSFSNITMSTATASWAAATDDVGVTGYQYRLNAGAWQSLGAVLSVNLANLSPATSYTFEVRARDGAANFGPASTGVFTTPDTAAPGAPGTPVFSNIAMNSATASWTAASDNVAVTGYEFRLNSGAWQALGNVLSINLTALSAATTYTFQVRARDDAGNLGAASSGSFTTVDTAAPSAPSGLSAAAPSSTTVNLTWSASTDNVAVSGYRIFRNGAQIATRTTTSYSDSGLSGSTTYTYAVSAYDAAGNNSAQSASVSVQTPDTLAPSTPTGLVASAASPTRVNLSWSASSDTGGSGLAGYRVYRNGAQITATAATSYADTGVAGGTTYSYTVAAYDNVGNVSAQSSAASATTPPALAAAVSSTTWNYLKVNKYVTYDPNVVVSPSGGSGTGYTYLWERISGDTQTSIIGATSNSVRWTRSTVPNYFVDYRSVWRCRVTDSAGNVVYAPNVTVNFRGEW